MALQSGNDLSGRTRQWIWRGAAALLIMPWLAVPVVGALAPDLSGSMTPPMAVSEELTSFEEPAFYEAPVEAEAVDATSIQPAVVVEQGIAIPWIEIIAAVVIGGWLLRGIAAGQAARHLGRIIAESRPGEGASLATLARWSRLVGLKCAPELRVVSAGTSPFSTGVRKPLVCLPEGIEESIHAETLDLVVGHECIHVARGDGWRRPLERSIADILWFNPFAWAIRRELDLARELACDEAVIAASSQRKAYARTLRVVAGMSVALPASAPAASMSLSGSGRLLAMRMKRTLDAAARRPAKAAIVGAVMLAFAATPMAIAQAILIEAVQPPDAPPAPPAPPPSADSAPDAPAPPAPPATVDAVAPVAPVTAPSAVSRTPHVAPHAPSTPAATPRPRPVTGAAEPPAPIYAPMDMRVTLVAADAAGTTVALESLATEGINRNCSFKVTGVTDVKVRSGETVNEGAVVGTRNVDSDRWMNCHMTFPQLMLFQGNADWRAAVQAAAQPPSASPAPAPTPRPPAVAPIPQTAPTPPTPPVARTPEQIQYTNDAPKLEGAPKAVITKSGARITSGFGYRTDPFTQETVFHDGVDIAAAVGTSVHTPGSGVVTFAGVRGDDGRSVEIALDDNHKVRFGHLNGISVVQGEALDAGDVIGTVGSSGRSDGAHLHLEFYRNGNSVDALTVEGLTLTTGLVVAPPPVAPAPPEAPAASAPEPIRFAPGKSGSRATSEPRETRAKNSTCVAELAGRTVSYYAGLDPGTPLAPQSLRQNCSRAFVGNRDRIRSQGSRGRIR
jgi:murein DD-endopeptidase MepM/ murein hydrolase activator NlpD/beta-lactamase regulating signal transducer with metallopeptidase domain